MNVTIKGYITDIFNSETYGNFEKRIFWLQEPASNQYPNHYELQMWQGDCNLLDKFNDGDFVECQVDLRGKHYSKNGKDSVFNTLKVWKITKLNPDQNPQGAKQQKTESVPSRTAINNLALEQEYGSAPDDLPF